MTVQRNTPDNRNELERLANSETTRMIEDILQGKPVEGPKDPTPTNRTHQEVLDSVANAYKNEVLGNQEKQA